MPRLRFEKTGNAVWISHLDLMRLFQRAFRRAGLPLTHTQGFNPRPSVSIALPLSVGVQSYCELLDFALDGDEISCEEILSRLNRTLIKGVRVLDVYENGDKIKNLALLDCTVTMVYDNGVSANCADQIRALFSRKTLLMEKKSKNGVVEQDVIPLIRSICVESLTDHTVVLRGRICCQNPTLNPAQLIAAVERYLPEYCPDHSLCCRLEIYDKEEKLFR